MFETSKAYNTISVVYHDCTTQNSADSVIRPCKFQTIS